MQTIDYKGVSGIYKIASTIDDRCYVGSAVSLYNRYHVHLHNLTHGKHHAIHLQRFVNKYGLRAVTFEVLERCDKSDLIEREQYWINILSPAFNTAKIAGNTLGVLHTPESRRKMSLAGKGHQRSLGRVLSHDTKRKIGESRKGKPLHPNFKAASIAANTGRKQTEAEIAKRALRQSKLGWTEMREIWCAAKILGVYQKDIAKAYGISQRLVCRVLHGVGIYSIYYEMYGWYFNAQEKRFAEHIAQPKLWEPAKAQPIQEAMFATA